MKSYPEVPGVKTESPETSRSAAEAVAERAKILREKVLAALAGSDATADELAARVGEDKLAVRPRVSELRKMGKVEPTDQRRRNESGATACVWRAVKSALKQGEFFA